MQVQQLPPRRISPIGPMVTSFPSKSEIGLNLSTEGTKLTFMGYAAGIDQVDVSNSNTPGVVDLTNPVGINAYRILGEVDARGSFRFTESNAYSGNNGVNTVYFVDPTLTICNDTNGVGLPPANATLPTAALAYDPTVVQTKGLDPNNMCVLKGSPRH